MSTHQRRAKTPAETVSLDTAPMEAKLVDALPTDEGWQFEPKLYGLDARPWTCFPRLVFGGRINQSHVHSTLSESHCFPTLMSMGLEQHLRTGRCQELERVGRELRSMFPSLTI